MNLSAMTATTATFIEKAWTYLNQPLPFWCYDERALSVARMLVARHGRDGAIEQSRAFAQRSTGPERAHWKKVSSAIWDITTPEVLYHL